MYVRSSGKCVIWRIQMCVLAQLLQQVLHVLFDTICCMFSIFASYLNWKLSLMCEMSFVISENNGIIMLPLFNFFFFFLFYLKPQVVTSVVQHFRRSLKNQAEEMTLKDNTMLFPCWACLACRKRNDETLWHCRPPPPPTPLPSPSPRLGGQRPWICTRCEATQKMEKCVCIILRLRRKKKQQT